MIEGAKMAKQAKQAEKESKQAKQTEAETEAHHEAGDPTQGDQTDGADATHADADQDKALFAQMIKQYMGDDADDQDPDSHEFAKQSYQAHREMGMEHESAVEAAGNHMKMAMNIGKKMHQAHQCKQAEAGMEGHEGEAHHEMEGEAHEADPATTTSPAPAGGGKKALPSNVKVPSTPPPANKESARVIQLLGEISRLKESLKKYEMEKYLDKKLSESGRSKDVTKKFREALGVARSKDHIDSAYKLFMTGADTAGAVGSDDFASFFYTEKPHFHESNKVAEGSLADCME